MVSDPVVGPVVGPYFLVEIPTTYLLPSKHFIFSLFFLQELLVEPLLQVLNGFGLVPVLVSLVLACGYYSCGNMRGSASTVSLIHMLASSSTRPVSIYPDFPLVNLEVFGYFRYDCHCGSAGVNSALFFSFRDSLHFMHAWFVLEVFVSVFSTHFENSLFAAFTNLQVTGEFLLYPAPSFVKRVIFVHIY